MMAAFGFSFSKKQKQALEPLFETVGKYALKIGGSITNEITTMENAIQGYKD